MLLQKNEDALPSISVPPIKSESPVAELVFGSISGFAGNLVEYPFDTGVSAPMVGSMAESAVLFLAYNQIQEIIKYTNNLKEEDELSTKQLCLAGGLSGAVVSYVLTPVELVKCRLQMQGYLPELSRSGLKHRGPISLFRHILRHEGVFGLYKGHTGTVLREVAGGAAWFVKKIIEMSETAKKKEDLAPWQLMCAGGLAGIGYNVALYPSDVVKSRIQSGLHNDDTFISASRSIYQKHGAKGFFRGFGITVARSAPASAVIFLTYEMLSRNFT
ncbi:hypothetical protein HDV06_005410 [Boothiomyces sp. JEL0866]|nr:hypothetical protein HDV06_005410 [Boothiomyces sp. JEL0866]